MIAILVGMSAARKFYPEVDGFSEETSGSWIPWMSECVCYRIPATVEQDSRPLNHPSHGLSHSTLLDTTLHTEHHQEWVWDIVGAIIGVIIGVGVIVVVRVDVIFVVIVIVGVTALYYNWCYSRRYSWC